MSDNFDIDEWASDPYVWATKYFDDEVPVASTTTAMNAGLFGLVDTAFPEPPNASKGYKSDISVGTSVPDDFMPTRSSGDLGGPRGGSGDSAMVELGTPFDFDRFLASLPQLPHNISAIMADDAGPTTSDMGPVPAISDSLPLPPLPPAASSSEAAPAPRAEPLFHLSPDPEFLPNNSEDDRVIARGRVGAQGQSSARTGDINVGSSGGSRSRPHVARSDQARVTVMEGDNKCRHCKRRDEECRKLDGVEPGLCVACRDRKVKCSFGDAARAAAEKVKDEPEVASPRRSTRATSGPLKSTSGGSKSTSSSSRFKRAISRDPHVLVQSPPPLSSFNREAIVGFLNDVAEGFQRSDELAELRPAERAAASHLLVGLVNAVLDWSRGDDGGEVGEELAERVVEKVVAKKEKEKGKGKASSSPLLKRARVLEDDDDDDDGDVEGVEEEGGRSKRSRRE